MTANERLQLTVIQGCAKAIEIETKNTPDSRAKGRTIVRLCDALLGAGDAEQCARNGNQLNARMGEMKPAPDHIGDDCYPVTRDGNLGSD